MEVICFWVYLQFIWNIEGFVIYQSTLVYMYQGMFVNFQFCCMQRSFMDMTHVFLCFAINMFHRQSMCILYETITVVE